MRFCLFNDLHLEFAPFDFPNEDTYDVMIWAGDIYPIKKWLDGNQDVTKRIPRDKPIYYVVGNHEYYHFHFDVEPLREHLAKEFPNITLLEDEWVRLDNDVVLYGMTMWTNFNDRDLEAMTYAEKRMNDYRYIYPKTGPAYCPITTQHTANKHDYSMSCVKDPKTGFDSMRWFGPVNDSPTKIIMITHHSPLRTKDQNIHDNVLLNPAYIAQDAVKLMDDHNVDHQIEVWCHGHTHEFRDEIYNQTRTLSNSRGYAGYSIVPEFKEEGLIFEVKYG